MDEPLILDFSSFESANNCLLKITQIVFKYFEDLGYEVKQENIWDEVKPSPDKTFYFSSPTSDLRFKDWRDYMPKGVYLGEEKPMPTHWIKQSED